MERPAISIIIPIFNTERFLPACLESVCGQTLQALDIILLDDGSTDTSGRICDQFARRDPRIRVFHTENRGHYQARNIAIQEARKAGSAYIGFVDSDDWVEPGMFEVLLRTATEADADIVECGFFEEYPGGTYQWLPSKGVYKTNDALCKLFEGKSHDYFWNKLWKISCFDLFPFPPVRAYADMIVTYRIYTKSKIVAAVDQPLYHYRQAAESIVHQKDMRLLGLWEYNLEKYDYIRTVLRDKIDAAQYAALEDNQLSKCVYAIGKNWVWWLGNPREEQEKHKDDLKAMSAFIRGNTPIFGRSGWGAPHRLTCFLARFPNRVSLGLARALEQGRIKFRKADYY